MIKEVVGNWLRNNGLVGNNGYWFVKRDFEVRVYNGRVEVFTCAGIDKVGDVGLIRLGIDGINNIRFKRVGNFQFGDPDLFVKLEKIL